MKLMSIKNKIEHIFRIYFPKRLNNYGQFIKHLENKNGIEIGGPTIHFDTNGFLPIYKSIKSLDNVNFSNNTVWEGHLSEGSNFKFGNKTGKQFITEASNLNGILDSTYDFLLSSHNIEHLANPINSILEWKRVVKPNGYFLFILPNKEGTFDHKRPITTIDHLEDDFTRGTKENDETHFEEVFALHDLSKDPSGIDFDTFKNRTLKNMENRCVHHHVFDLELMRNLAEKTNIEILRLEKFSKIHLVMLGINLK